MRQAGEVTYADAHKPRRNEGCVEFASERVSVIFENMLPDSEVCRLLELKSPF